MKLLRLALALLLLLLPAAAQQPPEFARGQVVRGAPGVRESVASIQERQRATPPQPIKLPGKPPRFEQRRFNPQNPAARPGDSWPPRGGAQPLTTQPLKGGSPGIYAAQTFGTSFTGATLSGTNPTGYFPPDSMGAVGPTQYVVVVNGRIVTFNKTTGVADGVLNATTNTLFNLVRNGSSTSDPRIRYDRLSQRWFIVIINVSTPNRILIAVTNTSDITPSTVFTLFYIPIDTLSPAISSTCLADYPTLGIDALALYIGTNNFCGSPSQTFHSTDGYVVRKSDLLAGTLTVTVFRALGTGSVAGPYTPQGVDNYDPGATEGYFIAVDTISFGTLMLRRVSDPGGTPAISANIAIATPLTTSFPIEVDHLGRSGNPNSTKLDALDDRLFAAHIRNGRLWTAHNIGVDNTGNASGTRTRNGSRWYEMSGIASPGTPAFEQVGTVYTASGSNTTDQVSYWIPSIMVSGQGHAAMGFSSAGTNARANAASTGRLASDTPGTMQAPADYTASSTAYNPNDNNAAIGVRRWGDYSYTSLDPNDDMTMWTIQEFCDTTDSYGVRVVKLIAPPPATPVSASPPSVANNQSGVAMTITGTSTSGSGFFDPGSGFANRIAASVTGGVTVNSVTYTSPTSITLNLNTTGVAPGSYNLTVTNPDGQSATTNGIIMVTSGGMTSTTTSLASNLNPATYGSTITFTATVSPGAATGNVTFRDGVTVLGTSALSAGVATLNVSTLAAGVHSITAEYLGDSTYSASTSSALSQTVTEKKRRGQTTSESARNHVAVPR